MIAEARLSERSGRCMHTLHTCLNPKHANPACIYFFSSSWGKSCDAEEDLAQLAKNTKVLDHNMNQALRGYLSSGYVFAGLRRSGLHLHAYTGSRKLQSLDRIS